MTLSEWVRRPTLARGTMSGIYTELRRLGITVHDHELFREALLATGWTRRRGRDGASALWIAPELETHAPETPEGSI